MRGKERINALLEANYYEQIIDEACNGDLSFNNQFRKSMTVADCVQSNETAEVWKRYAETV